MHTIHYNFKLVHLSIPFQCFYCWSFLDSNKITLIFHNDSLTPKVVDEVVVLQLLVETEAFIAPVTTDTSLDSPTSCRSPPSKHRQWSLADYKEDSSSADNGTSDHKVEESNGWSPDTETQAYTLLEQAPATFDTSLFLVISFVMLLFHWFIVSYLLNYFLPYSILYLQCIVSAISLFYLW